MFCNQSQPTTLIDLDDANLVKYSIAKTRGFHFPFSSHNVHRSSSGA